MLQKGVDTVLPTPSVTMLQTSKPARRWCMTLNNYTPEEGIAMQDWPLTYGVIGKEVGDSGTPHLQCYFVFKVAQRLSALKKLSSTAHWEVAKGTTEQASTYCKKEEDYFEIGTQPKTRKEIGDDQRERWQDVIRSAKEGTADDEYPREFIQYNSTINRLYQPKVDIINSYSGYWWTGPPGTGKSRKAREDYPDLYDKLLNKWWDGYVDEDVVLIDDICVEQKQMGTFLKRYADHYPFRAEYKGGSKVIRPSTIIVTSNYTIEEIWAGDEQMIAALKRRFKVTNFPKFF